MTKKQLFRNSNEWKEFSKRLREKYNDECQICGSQVNVGCHHLNESDYENISNEGDFACLCFLHHTEIHRMCNSKKTDIVKYLSEIERIYKRSKHI